MLRQSELKQISFISYETEDHTLSLSYFTSLLSVPVFTEALRKYPIDSLLDHMFCSHYELIATKGNGTVTVPARTAVCIPVFVLHHDKTYYPEPENFDPDRFTEGNINSRPNYIHIPFGEGPRTCLVKDRYLVDPRKNFRLQPMRIEVICSYMYT